MQNNSFDRYFNKIGLFSFIDEAIAKTDINIMRKIMTFMRGKDISDEVMKVLNIMTINDITKDSNKTATAGSFKWKAQKYPGDIDMLEFVEVQANSEKDAIDKIVKELHVVAQDIDKNDVILADFKCGFDPRFDGLVKNMGQLKGVYVSPDMIEYFEQNIDGYNRSFCELEIKGLYAKGVIPENIKTELLNILPDNNQMTGKIYAEMFGKIRKYRLLRWSLNDILNKVKVIFPANQQNQEQDNNLYFVKLEDALKHDTITKLDLWANIRGRWTEVTNIYIFSYKNINTNEKYPIGFKFTNTVDDATEIDIKYYSSQEHEKPYKLAKRIWNRAINKIVLGIDEQGNITDKIDPTQMYIARIIAPLFASDINAFGQIVADLELLQDALIKKNSLNLSYSQIYKDIFDQVEDIPEKLFRILLIDEDVEMSASNYVKQIIKFIQDKTGIQNFRYIYDELWDKVFGINNTAELLKIIEALKKLLLNEQNKYAKEYLMTTKLHPNAPNSIIQPKYSFNYLNIAMPSETNMQQQQQQRGGSYNTIKSIYDKYKKYKAKYRQANAQLEMYKK